MSCGDTVITLLQIREREREREREKERENVCVRVLVSSMTVDTILIS